MMSVALYKDGGWRGGLPDWKRRLLLLPLKRLPRHVRAAIWSTSLEQVRAKLGEIACGLRMTIHSSRHPQVTARTNIMYCAFLCIIISIIFIQLHLFRKTIPMTGIR
jgi:hypothetical protein